MHLLPMWSLIANLHLNNEFQLPQMVLIIENIIIPLDNVILSASFLQILKFKQKEKNGKK